MTSCTPEKAELASSSVVENPHIKMSCAMENVAIDGTINNQSSLNFTCKVSTFVTKKSRTARIDNKVQATEIVIHASTYLYTYRIKEIFSPNLI